VYFNQIAQNLLPQIPKKSQKSQKIGEEAHDSKLLFGQKNSK